MKIVAIIPAFNEEESIKRIIQKTREYVGDIIVIDDGSTDNTKSKAEGESVIIVHHYKNMGLGKSIADGINEALKLDADIIVQLDADGQHNPEEIPRLLAPLLDNSADVVVGSRFLDGDDQTMPAIKRAGNRIF